MIRNKGPGRRTALTVAVFSFVILALASGTARADDADCVACHETLSQAFEATIHGRVQSFETHDGSTGCISCHGDGTAHVDSGGEAAILAFGEGVVMEDASAACQTCHRSMSLHDWMGSAHPLNGVGCTDCHTVHVKRGEVERSSNVCMDCHSDVQAQLQYPSHHPVREGHMDCISCHNPHGSSVGMLKTDERPSELCLSCHSHLHGPFIFEHEAVSEGCETCHSPHGTVANNLLVQNEPFLCLQCHEMHFHAGLEGEEEEYVRIPRYDPANNPADGITYPPSPDDPTGPGGFVPNPWGESGYKRAFTTKCTQCHTEIHGSDLPSQTVPGVGRGLMR